MSDSHQVCTKEGEIASSKAEAQHALQQCVHIYTQIEELRNTLQHICFKMMACKEDNGREFVRLSDQLHAVQLSTTQNPNIQVNPTIAIKGENRQGEDSGVMGPINKMSTPVAVCFGAGVTVAFIILVFLVAAKVKGWL